MPHIARLHCYCRRDGFPLAQTIKNALALHTYSLLHFMQLHQKDSRWEWPLLTGRTGTMCIWKAVFRITIVGLPAQRDQMSCPRCPPNEALGLKQFVAPGLGKLCLTGRLLIYS